MEDPVFSYADPTDRPVKRHFIHLIERATGQRELKRLYHALFRGGQNLRAAVAAAQAEFTGEPARRMLAFILATQRGLCADAGFRRAEAEAEE